MVTSLHVNEFTMTLRLYTHTCTQIYYMSAKINIPQLPASKTILFTPL